MLMSAKAEYAIRALVELALHADERPLKVALIAARQQIPLKFLEVILAQLKGSGILASRRGAEGGYRLAKPAGEIRLNEVIHFVEGVSGAPPASTAGDEATTAVITGLLRELHTVSETALHRHTLADVVEQVQANRARHVVSWDI